MNVKVTTMENKFKIGDRVQVVKIDDIIYYSDALYSIDNVGKIVFVSSDGDYRVEFNRLKREGKPSAWWALEHWLEHENTLIKLEYYD